MQPRGFLLRHGAFLFNTMNTNNDNKHKKRQPIVIDLADRIRTDRRLREISKMNDIFERGMNKCQRVTTDSGQS